MTCCIEVKFDTSKLPTDAVVAAGGQAAAQLQQMATSLGDLSQAELTNISPTPARRRTLTTILKQLGETAFDNFETFFTDLTNATASSVPPIEIKQEENNNISSPASSSQLQGYYQQNSQLALPNNGQQRLQQLLRSGTSAINSAVTNNINNGRYNIASANPLLAEKLSASPSGIKQEPISSDYNTTSMNYGSASPMQRMPSGKPQVHDAGGGKDRFPASHRKQQQLMKTAEIQATSREHNCSENLQTKTIDQSRKETVVNHNIQWWYLPGTTTGVVGFWVKVVKSRHLPDVTAMTSQYTGLCSSVELFVISCLMNQ
ncbi:hypothetical protein SFRURICE_004852 [Spodoptera frugiperda]|nr:hypothetical protein SFRURICE_004852 [Spodoptera frugiperda]